MVKNGVKHKICLFRCAVILTTKRWIVKALTLSDIAKVSKYRQQCLF